MTRSSQKHHNILQAAIREFKAGGFENTSMDKIAMSAQVSKRTVYNHFASKEKLFDGIIEQMIELLQTSVYVEYSRQRSVEAQLRDFAEQEIALLVSPEFTDLIKVCLAEAIHNPQRIEQAMATVQNREGDLISWLSAANADNRLKIENGELAAGQFFGLIKTFCLWPQLIQGTPFPNPQEQAAIIDSTVTMFLSRYHNP